LVEGEGQLQSAKQHAHTFAAGDFEGYLASFAGDLGSLGSLGGLSDLGGLGTDLSTLLSDLSGGLL
jgi:hypothetical protein